MKIKKTINTPGGIFGMTVFGLVIFMATASFTVYKPTAPIAPTPTEYHFVVTLEFDGEDFARTQVPLPITGDAVVQVTASDEWALDVNMTGQWLGDLNMVSITAVNPVSTTLPLEVNVSVFPVNYMPLVSEGK